MKTTGFLTLHDDTYKGSKDLKELIKTPRAYTDFDKIINYLESGFVGKYDLYKLMQEYLTNAKKRDDINKIINKL